MVHELAKLVFTIPFNLRDEDENRGPFFVLGFLSASDTNTGLAFPAPDDVVRNYLVSPPGSRNSNTLKISYIKFFGSVFKQVNAELDKCHEEWEQISTAASLAKWWSKHLESIRSELYKAAVEGTAEPIEVRIRENGEKYRQSFFGRILPNCRRRTRSYSSHVEEGLKSIMPITIRRESLSLPQRKKQELH